MSSLYPEPSTVLERPISGCLSKHTGLLWHMTQAVKTHWQAAYPQGSWQTLDGETLRPAQLQQQLRTQSLWQQPRFFQLRAAHRLGNELLELLLLYAQQSEPNQWLWLTGEPLDKRGKFARALYQQKLVLTLPPPSPAHLQRWLEQRARSLHMDLPQRASQLLIRLMADDLASLEQALQVLCLAWPEIASSEQTLLTWIWDWYGDLGEPDTFGWLQLWLDGAPGAFGPPLLRALRHGAKPFALLFVAARTLRQLHRVGLLHNAPSQLLWSSLTQLPAKEQQRWQQRSRRWPSPALRQALLELPTVERRMKQGTMAAELILLSWLEGAQGYGAAHQAAPE